MPKKKVKKRKKKIITKKKTKAKTLAPKQKKELKYRTKKVARKKIVDKVKLKYAPEISFFFDETINEVKRLDELFSSEKVQNDTIR